MEVMEKFNHIFFGYQKEIKKEHDNWCKDFEDHKKEIDNKKNKIVDAWCKYIQIFPTINNQRSNLKESIDTLYGFLGEFGKAGKKITPFDFEIESWKMIDIDEIIPLKKPAEISDFDNNGTQYAGMGMATLNALKMEAEHYVPLAFSVLNKAIFSTIPPLLVLTEVLAIPNRPNKKDYEEYKTKREEANEEYAHNKGILNDKCKKIELATDIANLYYGTIGTVKEAINETIIPELSGIKAFLYATSIADKVAGKRELTSGIEPINILELEGTKYHEHYLFVKNAFDYYTLIVNIFTQPVLTNMLEDNEVTEKNRFEEKIRQIKAKQEELQKNALFTKES